MTIHSDHRPLESIFKKSMLEAPKRLQRMLLAVQIYDIKVVYKPGSEQLVADMRSHVPSERKRLIEMTKEQIFQTAIEDTIAEEVDSIDPQEDVNIGEPIIALIRRVTATDQTLQQLLLTAMSGWPEHKHLLAPDLKIYWTFRVVIVMIIPKQVQKNMLSRLHSSHQGVEATLRRARYSIYWHGMTNDIKEMIDRCAACENERPSQQKDTLQSLDIPSTPWPRWESIYSHMQMRPTSLSWTTSQISSSSPSWLTRSRRRR